MHLIVLTNRTNRYLPLSLASIAEHVAGVTRLTIVDDSGDASFRAKLGKRHEVVAVAAEPAGYVPAMTTVFQMAEGENVAFWEEDFLAIGPVDLDAMARALDEREHLAQLALMREPWYANEILAGGVLEAKAAQGDEIELVDGVFEHRAFFTCNPTVLPRRTLDRPWPTGEWSESQFGQRLLKDPSVRFGMLPGVIVEHVGERTGFGY